MISQRLLSRRRSLNSEVTRWFPPRKQREAVSPLTIIDTYLERPVTISHYALGVWFCAAVGITNWDLEITVRNRDALSIIQKEGYDTLPDLINKLKAYNLSRLEES